MKDHIKISAVLDACNRKADKSLSYRFVSALEGSSDNLLQADGMLKQTGWMIFVPNGVRDDIVIPTEDAPSDTKSHSKRLRSVLYVLWVQRGQRGDFATFYAEALESTIDIFKNKLED